MVKGVSRRVIIVKAPDPRLFEQAIFIVREDAATQGVSAEQVLSEAQRVADGYIRRNSRMGRRLSRVRGPAFLAVGAALASLAWGRGLLV